MSEAFELVGEEYEVCYYDDLNDGNIVAEFTRTGIVLKVGIIQFIDVVAKNRDIVFLRGEKCHMKKSAR